MRTAREVADDFARLEPYHTKADYVSALTVSIAARDMEHESEATRLRDQLRVAWEALESSERCLFEALTTGPELIYNWWLSNEAEIHRVHAKVEAAIASLETP